MHSGRGKYGAIIVGVVAAFAGGCARHAPLEAYATGEMHVVTGDSAAPGDRIVFDPADGSIRLFAAANASTAFQLVADADTHGAHGVVVSVSDLTGPDGAALPRDALTVYRALPVRVTDYPAWFLLRSTDAPAPRDYYDVLVPADSGRTWNVEPDGRFVAWVDVQVPRDAEPGRYRGIVTLSARDRRPRRFELELEVYDFVLPEARVPVAIGGFDHRDVFRRLVHRDGGAYVPVRLNRRDEKVREGLLAIRELMTLARRHRLDLFEKTISPVLKRDRMGDVRLDWDDYDAIVVPYISGSAFDDGEPVAFWPVPLHADRPEPRYYGGYESPRYRDVIAEVAEAIAAHLSGDDATGRWIYWPWRGDDDELARRRQETLVRAARPGLENVPVLSTLPTDGGSPAVDAAAEADMLAPPGEHFAPPTGDGSAEAWFSPGRPPYAPSLHVAAPPGDARALPWVTMRYNAGGLLIPEALNWDDPNSPVGLFHPGPAYGAEGILPSARLKRLRRGLEDATMCDLLRQRGREGIADAIANTLIRHAGTDAAGEHFIDARLDGWPEDAATWQEAGRLLADEVRLAVHADATGDRDLLRQRVAWRLLMERTRGVRLERVSSAVRRTGQWQLTAEMELDLSNPLSTPVTVSVEDLELPDGWMLAEGARTSLELDAGRRGTLRLTLVGDRVPVTPDGKLPVEMTLRTPGAARRLRTGINLLVVTESRRRPEIDGRLDDWPLGLGNVAGDFRLIGRRGRLNNGSPVRATIAVVLRHSQMLYVAFRCEEPDSDAMVVHHDNLLRHSAAMPFGEDLVEIVLDPGRTAQSPGNLYHIVVKPSGVVRTGRGPTGADSPGDTEPWSADVTAAVGRYDDCWMVELSVPLSAFGEDADAELWGVNFARFASAGSEASSWTGEPRCFYVPHALGTMLMRDRTQE